MHRSLAVLILAACSKNAEPPPAVGSASSPPSPPIAVADAAPPVATCIVRDNVDPVWVTPQVVELCSAEGASRSCWHFDIATKKIEARASLDAHAASPHASVTGHPDGTYTVCSATSQCSTATPKLTHTEQEVLAVNADATVVARIPDSGILELYDAVTWKLLAAIAPWRTEMGRSIAAATFAGPNVIAFAHASPVSSQGKIFTLRGKLVGAIGDKDFTQDEAASWPADGTTWLFKQIDRTRLIAVDVATGRRVGTYDVAPLAPGTEDDNVTAAGVAADADTIVYVSGSGVVGVIPRRPAPSRSSRRRSARSS